MQASRKQDRVRSITTLYHPYALRCHSPKPSKCPKAIATAPFPPLNRKPRLNPDGNVKALKPKYPLDLRSLQLLGLRLGDLHGFGGLSNQGKHSRTFQVFNFYKEGRKRRASVFGAEGSRVGVCEPLLLISLRVGPFFESGLWGFTVPLFLPVLSAY